MNLTTLIKLLTDLTPREIRAPHVLLWRQAILEAWLIEERLEDLEAQRRALLWGGLIAFLIGVLVGAWSTP